MQSIKNSSKNVKSYIKIAYSKLERVHQNLKKSNPVFIPTAVAVLSFAFGVAISSHLLPIYTSLATEDLNIQTDAENQDHIIKNSLSVPEKAALSELSENGTYSTKTYAYNLAKASATTASNTSLGFSIPALGINSPLYASTMSNKELSVPDYGVSSYGTLYMGHSSGVFTNLPYASVGQKIYINGSEYTITSVQNNQDVWANRQGVGAYSMRTLISLGSNQIVLMTCSGTYQPGFGWTKRTLVFASL